MVENSYIKRENLEEDIKNFLNNSEKLVCYIYGESGSGKSTFIKDFINSYDEKKCLFSFSDAMEFEQEITLKIFFEIIQNFKFEEITSNNIEQVFWETLRTKNEYYYIVLDSFEKFGDTVISSSLSDFGNFIDKYISKYNLFNYILKLCKYTGVKLIILNRGDLVNDIGKYSQLFDIQSERKLEKISMPKLTNDEIKNFLNKYNIEFDENKMSQIMDLVKTNFLFLNMLKNYYSEERYKSFNKYMEVLKKQNQDNILFRIINNFIKSKIKSEKINEIIFFEYLDSILIENILTTDELNELKLYEIIKEVGQDIYKIHDLIREAVMCRLKLNINFNIINFNINEIASKNITLLKNYNDLSLHKKNLLLNILAVKDDFIRKNMTKKILNEEITTNYNLYFICIQEQIDFYLFFHILNEYPFMTLDNKIKFAEEFDKYETSELEVWFDLFEVFFHKTKRYWKDLKEQGKEQDSEKYLSFLFLNKLKQIQKKSDLFKENSLLRQVIEDNLRNIKETLEKLANDENIDFDIKNHYFGMFVYFGRKLNLNFEEYFTEKIKESDYYKVKEIIKKFEKEEKINEEEKTFIMNYKSLINKSARINYLYTLYNLINLKNQKKACELFINGLKRDINIFNDKIFEMFEEKYQKEICNSLKKYSEEFRGKVIFSILSLVKKYKFCKFDEEKMKQMIKQIDKISYLDIEDAAENGDLTAMLILTERTKDYKYFPKIKEQIKNTNNIDLVIKYLKLIKNIDEKYKEIKYFLSKYNNDLKLKLFYLKFLQENNFNEEFNKYLNKLDKNLILNYHQEYLYKYLSLFDDQKKIDLYIEYFEKNKNDVARLSEVMLNFSNFLKRADKNIIKIKKEYIKNLKFLINKILENPKTTSITINKLIGIYDTFENYNLAILTVKKALHNKKYDKYTFNIYAKILRKILYEYINQNTSGSYANRINILEKGVEKILNCSLEKDNTNQNQNIVYYELGILYFNKLIYLKQKRKEYRDVVNKALKVFQKSMNYLQKNNNEYEFYLLLRKIYIAKIYIELNENKNQIFKDVLALYEKIKQNKSLFGEILDDIQLISQYNKLKK